MTEPPLGPAGAPVAALKEKRRATSQVVPSGPTGGKAEPRPEGAVGRMLTDSLRPAAWSGRPRRALSAPIWMTPSAERTSALGSAAIANPQRRCRHSERAASGERASGDAPARDFFNGLLPGNGSAGRAVQGWKISNMVHGRYCAARENGSQTRTPPAARGGQRDRSGGVEHDRHRHLHHHRVSGRRPGLAVAGAVDLGGGRGRALWSGPCATPSWA